MARRGGQHNNNTNRFGPITPPHDCDPHPRVQYTMDDLTVHIFFAMETILVWFLFPIFNGSNYNTWRRSMLIALNAKNKLDFSNLSSISSFPESMVFSAISSTSFVVAISSQSMKRNDSPICSHCGIMGYIVDRCYKLHRYPPGYKPMGKAQQQQQSSLQSSNKTCVSSSTAVPSSFAMTTTASSSSSPAPPEASSSMGPSISSCSGNLFAFSFQIILTLTLVLG
ncbi:hypothetical protein ACOSQ3_002412 [Xanthoceras sorbifolium]